MVGAHLLKPLGSLSDMACYQDAMPAASVLLFDLEGAACDACVSRVPFDQSAASAARTVEQINWLMAPGNEEQRMVSIARLVAALATPPLPPAAAYGLPVTSGASADAGINSGCCCGFLFVACTHSPAKPFLLRSCATSVAS